jgi:hypothetical protein
MRMHCKGKHQQSWTGDTSVLYQSVKVQTFFSSGGLQKYFLVDLGVEDYAENGERLDPNKVALQHNYMISKKCEKRLKTICK